MSDEVNKIVEIGTLGLVDDVTGVEGAQRAANEAAGVQSDAYQSGIDESRRQFGVTQENMAPWLQAGTGALGLQQDFLGLSGQDAQSQAYANYQESPGQKFLRERGMKATMQGAAASGGLGGGRVRAELNKQGIGFAAQDFGNYYNRLSGMSNTGQQTGAQLGQLGSQASQQVQTGLANQGAARASGILGGQQAMAQSNQNLWGLGSTAIGAYMGAPVGGKV